MLLLLSFLAILSCHAQKCCTSYSYPRISHTPKWMFPSSGPPPSDALQYRCPPSAPHCSGCSTPPYGPTTYGSCSGSPVEGCTSSGARNGYYPCESAYDSNSSAWVASSAGEGKWIETQFSKSVTVSKLLFQHPAHDHTILAMTLHFSDDSVQFFRPASTDEVQSFTWNPVSTARVRLLVEEVSQNSSTASIQMLSFYDGSRATGPFLVGVVPPKSPPNTCRWTGLQIDEPYGQPRTSAGFCNCDYGQPCKPGGGEKELPCPKEAPKCWGNGKNNRGFYVPGHCCELDVATPGDEGEGECDVDYGKGHPSQCGSAVPRCDYPCCGVTPQVSGFASMFCNKTKPLCVGLGLGKWPGAASGKGRCYADPHPVPPSPPPPSSYRCVSGQCTASSSGLPLSQCQAVCGPGEVEILL